MIPNKIKIKIIATGEINTIFFDKIKGSLLNSIMLMEINLSTIINKYILTINIIAA
jgi:hypothetical protein